ncbi:DUF2069 domain-containing protein [Peristeroidobacter soli]|uniref:DUF2069 domain-containing protein n=1 Tax=Peristeroidobacter soli TaxID=2497877 RepID=UPI00130039ED|nr:DUF2069 domain-containing protein [Peristeroidobacter soli]
MSNEALIARARFAVVVTIGILIAALIAWRVLTGFSVGDAALIVVLTLPLLIALPRLLRGHRRTYAWMTLAVTPFLVVAITEAVANPAGRVWAALCLVVAFVLFVLLIAYLRFTRGQA